MPMIVDLFVVILVCAAIFSMDHGADEDEDVQYSRPHPFKIPSIQERVCCTRAKCIHN